MPRTSKKVRLIEQIKHAFRSRLIGHALRVFESDDDDSFEDAVDLAIGVSLTNATKKRYLFRYGKYRKGGSDDRFKTDLVQEELDSDNYDNHHAEVHHQPWLSDDEFLHKYRMSRKNFSIVLDKIKDHQVFQEQFKRRQAPPAHQLMVFLKYVGTEGSGASNGNQRSTFAIGYGTALLYRERVMKSLRSLSEEYIRWPNEYEREQIAREIQRLYNFPHCVAIADGTLFPLAFEPHSMDAPDYSGRKYGYSLSTLIICDHKRRIRHYLAGFPGSAHDNRIWKASKLHKAPDSYFSHRQYCVGDSAFENEIFMVSAFKKPKDRMIPEKHVKFNEKLARMRIISEHCIGILKGRFPWLRSIRMIVTDDKQSLKKILRLLEATVILHNMLIEIGEEDRDEWIDRDDFSDLDDAERAPHLPGDALFEVIPDGAPNDERRTRLMNYFEEHYYF